MVWKETCAVDERMRFVMAIEAGEESFAATCRRFSVSRRVGYKWFARYRLDGVSGLSDRSRAPHRRVRSLSEEIAGACLSVRRAHPSWGPVKVRAWLQRRDPGVGWPAASTIGALFDREGLTVKRRLRRRVPPRTAPFAACAAANDVWCIDFKGWFRTGDGARCEPLTLSDAHSRYLLRCQAVARADTDHVWPILDAALREHGLPVALRSDTAWTSVGLVTTHTVTGLVNRASHSFEVRAVNGQGGGPAAQIQATPATKPSAPQELTARASAGRVSLAWSVPTDDGGSELLRYEIRHAKGASVPNDTAWTELELYRTYYFAGLDNGEQYSFEVRAVNTIGPGSVAPIQATPGGPPTAPEDLSAAPGDRQVVLQWERPASAGPSDVMNYEVRRAEGASVPENEQWFLVGIGTSTTQYGMTNGTLYTFEVRAVNVKAETGPAAQVQVTPVAKPTAPQGVAATTEDGGIVLRWSTPADNGGSEILRYEVRHAADVSVPEDKQWLSVGSSTSGTFSRLTNGALYTFEVRAVNAQGAGPAARIQVTPGLPNAPQSLSATPGNLRVTLNWDAPANNGGSGLLRYELRHANGTTVPTNTAWTTVGLITTHTVSGLTTGTLRTFELRAVNQRGAGPAAKVQAAPSARPTAPLGISATPVRNRVDLQWSAPASTGGADILRYEARYAQGATIPDNTRWYSIALDTTTTFIPLLYNRLYTFQVRAVNRHGAGPAAQTSHAIGGLSTVSIAAGQATVTEGDDAKFLLNRTGSTESSMSVGINIRGHRKIMSAATRTLADNTGPLPDTTVSFGVGVSEVTLRLTTEADSVSEGDGEISATIAGSPDYEAGSAGSATVLVEDDDIPVVTLRWISPAMTLRNNVWVGSMVEGQDIEFGVECSGNTLAPDGRAPRIPLRRQELLNHPTVPEYGVDQLVRFLCNTRWQRSGQQRYVGPNNGLIEIDLHQQVLNLHDLSGYFSTLLNKCAPATDDVRFCPKFTFGAATSARIEVLNRNPTILSLPTSLRHQQPLEFL